MPRAMRVCRTRDCIELTRSGLCDDCQSKTNKAHADKYPDYGPAWRRLSASFLRRYPYCFNCGNAAAVVDHIVSVAADRSLMLDRSNLQSLCRSCHGKKTTAVDGGFGRYAADGKALDQ